MKLIIGLGNPGKEYEHTRHNVGFMCVNLLREKFELVEFEFKKDFNADITKGSYTVGGHDEKFIIVKPQTYMNDSGDAVQKIAHFYKCTPQDIFVIYDDVDLPLGKIRLRKNGTPGTHNGMKSITQLLGTTDFPRLRIGIESRGETSPKEQDISSFVLTPFGPAEKEAIQKVINSAAESVLFFLEKGIEKTMEKYN